MMILKINTKAGAGQTVDRVGNYFSLVSCSAGKVRVKAFDAQQSELFNSVLQTGASVDFDFMASKLELVTESDAEVVIFWNKSKYYNPLVNIAGAGIARMKTVAVDGLVKLNSVSGQNKEIIVKSKTGKVFLSGQLSSQIGGFEVSQGEALSLKTSGDIFARGVGAAVEFGLGAVEDKSNQGITYYAKQFDKNGLMYAKGSNDGLIAGVGHVTHPSWVAMNAALAKWRDRLFIVAKPAGLISVIEIVDGKQVPFKRIVTPIFTSGTPPNSAFFSNDGNYLYCSFANAQGGARIVIVDLALGKINAEFNAEQAGIPSLDAVAPYNDGFLVAFDKLYFLSVNGEVSPIESTGYSAAGLNGRLQVCDGNICVYDNQSQKLQIAYAGSLTFESHTVSGGGMSLVGDLALVITGAGLWAKPRFGAPELVSLGASNAAQTYDLVTKIAANGQCSAWWSTSPMTGASKLLGAPVGLLTGSVLPELVDVVELF